MEILQLHPLMTILVALISGGVITWVLNKFWLSKKEEADVAKQLRDEMHKYISDFDVRLSRVQKELDDWREKYFRLLEDHTALKLENMTLRAELDLINPKPVLYRDRPEPTPNPVS